MRESHFVYISIKKKKKCNLFKTIEFDAKLNVSHRQHRILELDFFTDNDTTIARDVFKGGGGCYMANLL